MAPDPVELLPDGVRPSLAGAVEPPVTDDVVPHVCITENGLFSFRLAPLLPGIRTWCRAG